VTGILVGLFKGTTLAILTGLKNNGDMPRKVGVAKYYIVIGRHPKPKPRSRKKGADLRVVGKSIPVKDFEILDKEFAEHLKHEYKSILEGSLCENRSDARSLASYFEKKGYVDVEVCAVVPLKRFVREPRLLADEPEK